MSFGKMPMVNGFLDKKNYPNWKQKYNTIKIIEEIYYSFKN